MRIAVVGEDKRLIFLARLLRNLGHDVTKEPCGAELAVCTWPPAADVSGAAHIVCCGPKNAPEGATDLLNDEIYMNDIAYMTAEGTVAAAMAAGERVLKNSRCMVVGWGRIGRALTEILVSLGAKVIVLSRRVSAFGEISAYGATCGCTSDAAAHIPKVEFVFSTPPDMVLNGDVLSHADKNVKIVDISSSPYGVDLEAAREIGLHAWREPALPGRYCPETAAAAILHALERNGLIKGEEMHGT